MPEAEAIALACCVTRAQIASGRQVDSSNDVYWHTREKCVEMARSRGMMTAAFIRLVAQANGRADKEVLELSSPFWPQVAHPLILAREVMES